MSTWSVAAQNLPLILRGMYEYNVASRFGPLKPREWLFPVTYRCDARCLMCNIWQTQKAHELSLRDWEPVLADPLFAGIESVSLTGGEPTLRPDLLGLSELLVRRLPSLQRVTITTNALQPERVFRQCEGLLGLCSANGIRLFAGISLDGVGSLHDQMRGLDGAFARVQETCAELLRLRSRGLRLGVNCTLTGRNLHGATDVHNWAADQGLPVNYIVASFAESYYANDECADELAFSPQQRTALAELLRQLGSRKTPGNLAAYFYTDAAAMVERGARRTTPCVFQKDAFILDARGDMQYCMYSRQLGNVMQQDASSIYLADSNLAHRQDIVTRRCSRCTITCFLELGLAKDAFRYARFLMGGRP